MHNWHELTYLKNGTPCQRAVYNSLCALGLFDTLKPFSPILVGSIPIDIDIPDSDVDIICQADSLDTFKCAVQDAYGEMPEFQMKQKFIERVPSVVIRFPFDEYLIEIFGQSLPIESQRAYRHMIIEARLLELSGEKARTGIRKLKGSGLKTEPAFGRYFQLEGDPYLALLKLENLSDHEILQQLSQSSGDSDGTKNPGSWI
jgi:hypothetical protein